MQNYTIYVTEEIAKKAIKKGYNPHSWTTFPDIPSFYLDELKQDVNVPTAEQLYNWIEIKYNLICWLHPFFSKKDGWKYSVLFNIKKNENSFQSRTELYVEKEDAVLAGIDMALDLI